MVARSSFCCAVSWHLFAGYARRIRDAGTTVWRKFSRIRRGGAGLFASHYALSNRADEDKVRSKFVSEVSRVSSSSGPDARVGIPGVQDLLSEMKLRTQNHLDGNPTRIIALVFAALLFWQPALLRAQSAKKPAATASTSKPNVTRVHPFEPTEELLYVAEFSRALLKKVDVADFRFTASKQPSTSLQKVSTGHRQDKGRDPYLLKFTGDVSSKGFFAKLFNLRFREQIESIVDPASFTVRKTKRVDEQGKRARVSETIYDDGKVTWVERDPNDPSRPPREAVAPFAGQVQDVLSAIYYLRTQPLEVGKSFEVTISDSGVVYQVPVQVIEKKRKKTVLGRVDAFRVEPEVFGPDRMISGEGRFTIWITSDNRRVPVSARIKMKYGTFDITLRKVIRNPPQESLAGTKGN